MAEIATIARPYAEALFKASAHDTAQQQLLSGQLDSLAALAGNEDMLSLADNPKVSPMQVFDVIGGIAMSQGVAFDKKIVNLLQTVADNGRLSVLPEIANRYHALVNGSSGVSDAMIHSAFPIDDGQLKDVLAALERRFARKLSPTVQVDESLIGGIRVVVGDEVLDTSVAARLEQMKQALTA